VSIWQILVIVAAGVGFGLAEPDKFTYALGHATLSVFLPPLLFEAAWNLHYRAIAKQWPAIATLAGPGVLLTATMVAVVLTIVRVPAVPALLAGAILSATDPIAVVAVFRRVAVPRTLATIVECESLFNDAVAVLLYRGILGALALGAGAAAVAWSAILTLAGAAAGVLAGAALAFGVARALRGRTDARTQIVATLVCAYGVYFAADALHLSGIFATIAFGIALRFYERRWLTLTMAEDVHRFWDVAALLANGLVFFLVGASLQLGPIARTPLFVGASLVAIAVARYGVAGMLLPGGFPRSWLEVVRVAGMRGALSIALALALPPDIPLRGDIVAATFAVALATLAVGAFAVEAAVRRAAGARSR